MLVDANLEVPTAADLKKPRGHFTSKFFNRVGTVAKRASFTQDEIVSAKRFAYAQAGSMYDAASHRSA